MSSLWKERKITHDRFSVIKAKTPVKNLPLSNFTFVLICTITIYLKSKKINNFLGTIWERPMGVIVRYPQTFGHIVYSDGIFLPGIPKIYIQEL